MNKKGNVENMDTQATGLKVPPIYRESLTYARDQNELDKYHGDVNLNMECLNAIDTAIRESRYKTYHYSMKDAVQQVADTYGAERVELIMAKVVQDADWDGRYSRQNKDWAKGFEIPKSMDKVYSNTHPVLLDGFLTKLRDKPSVLEALKTNTEKSPCPTAPKAEIFKSADKER